MTEKQYVEGHHDLLVYKKSRWLARELFEMSNSFPKEEIHALTSQIRRSSRSIGAQIAEAWAKRGFEKHFAGKLSDADAEQAETQHWIERAHARGLLSEDGYRARANRVGQLVNGLLRAARRNIRETRDERRESH